MRHLETPDLELLTNTTHFFTVCNKMGIFDSPKVITLLVVQMWWIAIWGLSYITIEYFVGKNKLMEFGVYIGLTVLVTLILQLNPHIIEAL